MLGSSRSRALDLSGLGSFSVRFGRWACIRLSRGRAARIRSGSFTREGAGCAAVRFACGFSGFAGLTDGPRHFGDAEFTEVADIIAATLVHGAAGTADDETLAALRGRVRALTDAFPLYPGLGR